MNIMLSYFGLTHVNKIAEKYDYFMMFGVKVVDFAFLLLQKLGFFNKKKNIFRYACIKIKKI